jgi:hypothetical protein
VVELVGSLERARAAKIAELADRWGWSHRPECEPPVTDPPLELLQRGEAPRCAQLMEGARGGRPTAVYHWVYRQRVARRNGGSIAVQDGVAGVLDLAADVAAKRSRRSVGFVVLSRLVVLMELVADLPALRVDGREEIAQTGLGWYPFDKRYTITTDDDSFADALMQQWLKSWLRKQRYSSFEVRGRWVVGVRVPPRVSKIERFVAAVEDLCDRLPDGW